MPQPLAEIVIEEELATPEGVSRAAASADRQGIPLVVPLVRDIGVDEVALVAALRKRARVSVADPAKAEVDPDALREVARDMCRRLKVMPLSVATYDSGPRLLRLAMADPTDTVAIAEVEHHTGCRVEPALMTLSAIDELVETSYRHFVTEVIKRGGSDSAPHRSIDKSKSTSGDKAQPTTVPFRRLTDEATTAERLEALVSLLIEKGILDEEDYDEKIRQLVKRDGEPA